MLGEWEGRGEFTCNQSTNYSDLLASVTAGDAGEALGRDQEEMGVGWIQAHASGIYNLEIYK